MESGWIKKSWRSVDQGFFSSWFHGKSFKRYSWIPAYAPSPDVLLHWAWATKHCACGWSLGVTKLKAVPMLQVCFGHTPNLSFKHVCISSWQVNFLGLKSCLANLEFLLLLMCLGVQNVYGNDRCFWAWVCFALWCSQHTPKMRAAVLSL